MLTNLELSEITSREDSIFDNKVFFIFEFRVDGGRVDTGAYYP
jgi:hypothetical protein